ncbi:MAG TPA: MATE family efflux transporter, partial [Clostridiales bacterium]|nr:MATE family efflux transporter [Clostridiales bacterium]
MQNRLFSDKQLIKLMIPLVIEQGLTILVGMCDGVMVSAVSEAAISGVSLVDMINAVILVLFAALATGGAVVTSQLLGARRMADARRSAGQLVTLTFAMGCLMMTLCLVFARQLLHLFFGSIDADVMAA